MKIVIGFFSATFFLVILSLFSTPLSQQTKRLTVTKLDSCYFDSKKLYGRIQLVEYKNEADITVKIVNSFPDLKVQFVEGFADDCGEWEIVEHNGDLKVYITESFPDIKIKVVNSFPGKP